MTTVTQEASMDREWDDFVASCEYSGFMQSSAWARVKQEDEWEPHRIAVRENGSLVAAALILQGPLGEGRSLLYSPQGPALAWHDDSAPRYLESLVSAAASLATQTSAVCWRMEPWALHMFSPVLEGFEKSAVDMQPRHTALIPLLTTLEETLAAAKPKVRYNIALAARHGVKVSIGSSERAFHRFYRVYKKTVERKSLEHKEPAYFDAIRRHMGPSGGAYVLTAHKDGTDLASIVLIRFGDRLVYFFGGFDREYRALMAPFACHAAAIRLGYSLGCSFYDLWGIADTDSPDHPWSSITSFKMGFRPLRVSLVGAHDAVFSPDDYARLRHWEESRPS